MEVLSKVMNLKCCTYDPDFCNHEELHEADAGEELAKSLECLLYDHSYNDRSQSELENTSYD